MFKLGNVKCIYQQLSNGIIDLLNFASVYIFGQKDFNILIHFLDTPLKCIPKS